MYNLAIQHPNFRLIYELDELRFHILRAVQVLEPVAASLHVHALDHVQEHPHHPQVPRAVGKLEHGEELVALPPHLPTHLAPVEEGEGGGD